MSRLFFHCAFLAVLSACDLLAEGRDDKVAVNKKDDGYRGIWYHTFSRGMAEA